MGGSAQKQKFVESTFFFFTKIKLFLRHLALFTTLSVDFAHKFLMNKGFAERFAVNSRKKKKMKKDSRAAVLHDKIRGIYVNSWINQTKKGIRVFRASRICGSKEQGVQICERCARSKFGANAFPAGNTVGKRMKPRKQPTDIFRSRVAARFRQRLRVAKQR